MSTVTTFSTFWRIKLVLNTNFPVEQLSGAHVFSGSPSQGKLPLFAFAVLGLFSRPLTFSPKHYFYFFAPSNFLFLCCVRYLCDRLVKYLLFFAFQLVRCLTCPVFHFGERTDVFYELVFVVVFVGYRLSGALKGGHFLRVVPRIGGVALCNSCVY